MKFWCVMCIFSILQVVSVHSGRSELVTKSCQKPASYSDIRKNVYLEQHTFHSLDSFNTKDLWYHRPKYLTKAICCPGFKETDDSMCEPICNPPCGNGTCTKSLSCECDAGYNLEHNTNNTYACVPMCSRHCTHGKCITPGVCTCDEGYSSNDNITCTPICNIPCRKGSHCVKPDECACLPGYHETITFYHPLYIKEWKPVPVCKSLCDRSCLNGKCDEDHNCICDQGYEHTQNEKFSCTPICKECNFGTCTAPNVCTCDKGYEILSRIGLCKPICKNGCLNGICVASDTCKCLDGYKLHENLTNICEPICQPQCINGTCTAPSKCTCKEGYKLYTTLNFICKPHCDLPCEPYGQCISPNKCDCHEGYELTNNTQIKAVDSNVKNATFNNDLYFTQDSVCKPNKPTCEQICINGFCTAQHVCECHKGYRLSKTFRSGIHNSCEPICEPECKNGFCVEPNMCSCKSGYNHSQHFENECDPMCHPRCKTNEICTAEQKCVCKDNYRRVYKNFSTFSECQPICRNNCANGTCVAPNVCKCSPGYHNVIRGKCIPTCKKCSNGACVKPEHCTCHSGWTGIHCDKKIECLLILNNDKNYLQTVKITNYSTRIKYDVRAYQKCPKCINKLNNEILCFNINTNDTRNSGQIGCLMDGGCFESWSQYKNQNANLTPIITCIGILILMLSVVVAYIWIKKYRNYRPQFISLSDVQTSMRRLIERED